MRVKAVVISILSMLLVSILSLIILSVLTYILKWQADKAMAGIIATYVLAGFAGGFCLKWMEKRENVRMNMNEKIIESFFLSVIFILLLVVLSIFAFQNPFAISSRFLIICILIMSSCFLGRIL